MNKIIREEKTLKIFTVGSKGHDQLKRIYGKYIVEKINYKGLKKKINSGLVSPIKPTV